MPLVLSLVFGARGVQAADYWSPRTAALGGAGHAAPLLTDAIYMNPAMASFINGYTGSVSFTRFSGPDENEPKGRIRHFSVIDSTNPDFQSGLGFTQTSYGSLWHGILSRRFMDNLLAAGIGVKHLGGSGSRASSTNFSLGAISSPLPWAAIGLYIENLKQSPTTLQWSEYRSVTLGLKANIQNALMVYVDPRFAANLPRSMGYSAGLEIPIVKDGFIRIGRSKNSFQPNLGSYGDGVGFGTGFIFPRFGIDFAHFRTTGPTRSEGSSLALSATF